MSESLISVEIYLKETSQKLAFQARNTYTKGPFYCVYLENGNVEKIPVGNIFKVTESYSKS